MSTKKKLETFHISTYGCQMNLADSSTIASSLTTRGYRRVADENEADIIVLNTCSVREKAEDRVFGRLGEIFKHKKRKPHLKIAVVGCMAQRLADGLKEKAPHVDYILGTDRQFELPDVLEGREGTHEVMTAFGHENIDAIQPVKENEHSGFVTISRGCDNFCTYCIVPYVRGREQSHSADHVVEAVNKMVNEGAAEVTLLGQNVNSYRHEGTDFPGLLQRVAGETGVRRIRYMTSHPKDLSRRLVDVMAEEPKLTPHVHLPLQSGSDRVLRQMGRVYSYDHYRKIIDYIRDRLPYVSITTDLIVGFPSETLDEYEMTLKAVREIRFDSAFMFRYSVRPGTTAAKYEDDVPEAEKIERLNKLIKIQQDIAFERNQREVGRVALSLVEGLSRRSKEYARARTDGNKTVLFKTHRPPVGSIIPVKISSADAFTLHGEPVEEN
ncbi:MAG: tRNA (N6-isopentenyl adenosine(37)-C2)-methylthiotransferase MiaB [bacterium]|nr:tRNA (N6-isopentenyl adenosine(37)-C2)-methylthiotransferase MiaB [bacterium]